MRKRTSRPTSPYEEDPGSAKSFTGHSLHMNTVVVLLFFISNVVDATATCVCIIGIL